MRSRNISRIRSKSQVGKDGPYYAAGDRIRPGGTVAGVGSTLLRGQALLIGFGLTVRRWASNSTRLRKAPCPDAIPVPLPLPDILPVHCTYFHIQQNSYIIAP
jgi:hypothetical protein